MALASIPVPPDPNRDTRARELVNGWRLWPVKTLKRDEGAFKRGDQFFVINGHDTSAVFCSCPDYQKRGAICAHIRAVVLLDRQSVTTAEEIEEEDPTVDLAFAALALAKRGPSAAGGVTRLKYEDIWTED